MVDTVLCEYGKLVGFAIVHAKRVRESCAGADRKEYCDRSRREKPGVQL